MSFDLNELTIDPEMEKGVWAEFYGDSRLLIASADSHVYQSYLARLGKKHQLKLDDSNPKYFDLIRDITAEAMSKHILKDWEGIKINGVEVPYDWETGKKALLTSPKLYAFVTDYAAEYRNYQKQVEEDVKKP